MANFSNVAEILSLNKRNKIMLFSSSRYGFSVYI